MTELFGGSRGLALAGLDMDRLMQYGDEDQEAASVPVSRLLPREDFIDEAAVARQHRPRFARSDKRQEEPLPELPIIRTKNPVMLREEDMKDRMMELEQLMEKLPKSVHVLLTKDNVPLFKTTKVIRGHPSYYSSRRDGTLRFTTLFGPDPVKPYGYRKKKQVKKRPVPEYPVGVDEADTFSKEVVTIPMSEIDTRMAEQPGALPSGPETTSQLRRTSLMEVAAEGREYLPIELVDWEAEIIFDTDNVQQQSTPSPSAHPASSQHYGNANHIPLQNTYGAYRPRGSAFSLLDSGALLPPIDELKTSTLFTSLLNPNSADHARMGSSERLRWELETFPTNFPSNLDISSNRTIRSLDWSAAISWDGTVPSGMSSLWLKLLLDVNDPDMLFEEERESEDEEEQEEAEEEAEESSDDVVQMKKVKLRAKRRTLKLPNKMMTARDLALKQREEALHRDSDIDPFNLSNDKFYIAQASYQIENLEVEHSLPGLRIASERTIPPVHELSNFHRPRAMFNGSQMHIVLQKKRRQGLSNELLRNKKDLSARQGRVILLEYMEEFPPVLSNPGMAASVRCYYRMSGDDDQHSSLQFADGEVIKLRPDDKSPFIAGLINLGCAERQHEVVQTDFLLVRQVSKSGNVMLVLRDIPALYTAGQILPLKEVPAPNSRAAMQMSSTRLQATIYRLFLEQINRAPDQPACITLSELQFAFPGQSENSVRKKIKNLADFKRGNDEGAWVLKDVKLLPSEEDIRKMTPADDVALYESMLAGEQRLLEYGIHRHGMIRTAEHSRLHYIADLRTTSSTLRNAVYALSDGHRLHAAARTIEEEILLSPWNLTGNFVDYLHENAALQLTGLGDPSGRGEAFSFLRLPQKIVNPKPKEERDLPKVVVTGTDADLRKLTLVEIDVLLRRLGVSEEEISTLHRWKKVDKIRELSNDAKSEGNDRMGVMKFARGKRFSMAAHVDQMQEKLERIWQNQINVLSATTGPESSEDDDSEVDLDFIEEWERDVESSMLRKQKKEKAIRAKQLEMARGNPELEEERAAYGSFMRSIMQGDDQHEEDMVETTVSVIKRSADNSIELASGLKRRVLPSKSVQRYFIKRTRIVTNDDGSTAMKVDLITDPEEIGHLERAEKRQRSGSQRFRLQRNEQDERMRRASRGEKKLQQDRLRRQKQVQKIQAELRQRYLSGNMDGSVRNSDLNVRCSNCGMSGHKKSAPYCPVYVGSLDDPYRGDGEINGGEVENHPKGSSGLSVRISTNRASGGSSKPTPKRKRPSGGSKSSRSAGGSARPRSGSSGGGGGGGGGSSRNRSRSKKSKAKENDEVPDEEISWEEGSDMDEEEMVEVEEESDDGNWGDKKNSNKRDVIKQLNAILAEVLERISNIPDSIHFLYPVDKRIVRDYYVLIAQPIALSDMKKKAQSNSYESVDDFRSDMQLMHDNCVEYNTDRPSAGLITMSSTLLRHADSFIEAKRAELDRIEVALGEPGPDFKRPRYS